MGQFFLCGSLANHIQAAAAGLNTCFNTDNEKNVRQYSELLSNARLNGLSSARDIRTTWV